MAVQRVILIQRSIERLRDQITETELNRRADNVLALAKALAPRSGTGRSLPSIDSGQLADSLVKGFTTQRGRKVIRIFSNATNARGQLYARFVIRGTKPHIINAKTQGKRLRFFWIREGRIARPFFVRHPGTEPNNFLREALRRAFLT